MADGETDGEIVDFLVARYGDFVMYRPLIKPETWALWAGPFVFLAIGALVFWRVLKTRRAQPLDEDPTP
jgi:cytochrome c-type biogenesis protein CcmH